MEDKLFRALSAEKDWMIICADVTKSLIEAMKLKPYGVPAATAVGKMLLCSAMMASLLKDPADQLSISVQSFDGLTSLIATANGAGEIKAYAKDPKQEQFIGSSSMNVIRDIGLKQPYQSTVLMDLHEFESGMDSYFSQSEQLETHTKFCIHFREDGTLERAFGYMIQMLPFASQESKAAARDSFDHMPTLEGFLFRNSTLEDIAKAFFGNKENSTEFSKDLIWRCSCSKEKGENALKGLGEQELQSIIDEGKVISIECGFCGKQYFYTIEEIEQYLEESKAKHSA